MLSVEAFKVVKTAVTCAVLARFAIADASDDGLANAMLPRERNTMDIMGENNMFEFEDDAEAVSIVER